VRRPSAARGRGKAEAFLRSLVLVRDRVPSFDAYPFDIPAVRELRQLDFGPEVTILVGENGSGKSTLVEAIAVAAGFNPEGGSRNFNFETRRSESALVGAIRLVRGVRRPRTGFFLRAESFFNVAQFIDSGAIHAPDLSLYGDTPLHKQSHGESFLALAANRFGGTGLYLLDEPEAALSVTGALALLAVVARASGAGGQFVIATHSPILLACPDARIYELDGHGVAEREYDDLDAVRLTRAFLEGPERYLRAALDQPRDE
jgi:predicted ATPase